jgi:hypothetical protein
VGYYKCPKEGVGKGVFDKELTKDNSYGKIQEQD